MRLSLPGLTVLFSLMVCAGSANAQDDEARHEFALGRQDFDAAHYETALAHFQRSYDLSHRPALLYNVGQCQDRLANHREALAAFERYLREAPDAENRAEVEVRIQALRRSLAERDAVSARNAAAAGEGHAAAPAPSAPSSGGGGGGVLSEWWFWTLVGVVAVGAAVGVTLALTVEQTASPVPGSVGPGGIVAALEGR